MTDRHDSRPLTFADPHDDIGSNPAPDRPLGEIIQARLSRRSALKGLVGGAMVLTTSSLLPPLARADLAAAVGRATSLDFEELPHGVEETHGVSPGHTAQVLLRWGDPLHPDAPDFDPAAQTPEAQEQQFGYNCDYVAFMPLPLGSASADRGLLCVNHEYTNTDLMFPGITADNIMDKITPEQVEIELAAHGHSVVEIARTGEGWQVVRDSPYNRRLSMLSTPMRIAGPAAGHDRLKTSTDSTGKEVIGTLNNCAGGKTPWGTVLVAEENFHQYFSGDPAGTPEAENYARYGISNDPAYPWWGKHVARFDLSREPNEPNRFGWVVEYDPYDPDFQPVKRTSLGRFKHEGANSAVDADGRVVIYSGDDERFDYLYKFVTSRPYDPADRAANRDLLDEGTLYVAKFHDDGRVTWLPLVHGQGPLTGDNGFASQGDVMIETRRAADLLGATPMDRPEDVEANPATGVVYVALTNNTKRQPDQVDAVNPRADNAFGHIVALLPPGAGTDKVHHAAEEFRWELPLMGGDPQDPALVTRYHSGVSDNGWFAAPDNVAFDGRGRLWIATDQGSGWKKTGFADGIYACDTLGAGAYLTRHFFRVPIGAEMCGPEFTPDDTTLFVAVQHPASDGVENSTFDSPATRWPDFQEGMPPRPSVVAISREDGGRIGG